MLVHAFETGAQNMIPSADLGPAQRRIRFAATPQAGARFPLAIPARRIFQCSRADLRDLNLCSWVLLVFIVLIAANQALHQATERDFVYFYSLGHILNHYAPERLYDFGLQRSVFESVLPLDGNYGPSPYPPFLAMLFQPLARLPYWTACRIWIAISLALYTAGLALLIRRFCGRDWLERALVLCFGLLFWPFISWVLLGGQVSVIGFLAIALAVCWADSGSHFKCGAALAVCTYKPTLLVLLLPVLLIQGRFKAALGFAAGAIGLVALPTLAHGPIVWAAYVHIWPAFSSIIGGLRLFNYVDLRAFLAGFPNGIGRTVFTFTAGIGLVYMALTLWNARHSLHRAPVPLMYATALTWTLLLNVYVPVYDTILVIISLVLSAGQLLLFARRAFFALCLALLVGSYLAPWIAHQTGWQILTPLLVLLGILQISAMRLAARPAHAAVGR